MQFIKKHSHRKQDINIHWVVGHKDVPGNTKADEEAKKAPSSSNPQKCLLYYLQEDHLPLSVFALLQQRRRTETEGWNRTWTTSKQSKHLQYPITDNKLLTGSSFLALTLLLTQNQALAYMWLRIGHCPLNFHLHRIKSTLPYPTVRAAPTSLKLSDTTYSTVPNTLEVNSAHNLLTTSTHHDPPILIYGGERPLHCSHHREQVG